MKQFITYITTILFIIGLTSCGSIKNINTNQMGLEDTSYEENQELLSGSIELYDTSLIHDISIDMSQEDYDEMIRLYQDEGEKEYFKVDVSIDGIVFSDVGIRLKGNSTLRDILGGKGSDGGFPQGDGMGPMEGQDGEMRLPPGVSLPDDWETMNEDEQQAYFETLMQERFGDRPERNIIGSDSENPPYLLNLGKYIDGQNYNGYTKIAIRLGSDLTKLSEPVAFALHEQAGQIVPQTAFAKVSIAGNEDEIYVITEHINEDYIFENFETQEGYLFKAENFVGFSYKGEEMEDYTESYDLKMGDKQEAFEKLIEFMAFVSESSIEDFDNQLENYMDIYSFATMMALDELLNNTDSFSGMGSNYYLYYHKEEEKFYFLSWDQNLAITGMGPGQDIGGREGEEFPGMMRENMTGSGAIFDGRERQEFEGGGGGPGRDTKNELKDKFGESEKFSELYEQIKNKLSEEIFTQGAGVSVVNQLSSVLEEYLQETPIIPMKDYREAKEKFISFFTQ